MRPRGGLVVCSLGSNPPAGATLSTLEGLAGCDRIFVERPSPFSRWALAVLGRRSSGRATASAAWRELRRGFRVGLLVETRPRSLTALRRRCLAAGLSYESVPAPSSIDGLLAATGKVFGHDFVGFAIRGGTARLLLPDGRIETFAAGPSRIRRRA